MLRPGQARDNRAQENNERLRENRGDKVLSAWMSGIGNKHVYFKFWRKLLRHHLLVDILKMMGPMKV